MLLRDTCAFISKNKNFNGHYRTIEFCIRFFSWNQLEYQMALIDSAINRELFMAQFTTALSGIFFALVCGFIVGWLFPSQAVLFMPLSHLVLQLIKAAAAPLVFFAVLESILRFSVQGSDFFKLLVVTLTNACFAVLIGLGIANIFQPGQYLKFLASDSQSALKNIDFLQALEKQVPASIVQPFADNSIMSIVLIGLAFGFAWRTVKDSYANEHGKIDNAEVMVTFGRQIAEIVLNWVVKLVPLAVFAASAKVSAEHGLQPLKGLGWYVGLCLLGMALHILFIYGAWLVLVVRVGFFHFWRFALKPMFYALSLNSSLVALPLTLQSLDQLGVSRRASTLAACIGTNLNNDGIILYEGFTLIALAQASGMSLSVPLQIFAALYCIIAAMGVAGVPEAGVVALTLVMVSLGLPTESLAVLLSVDFILARARSLLNTSSDMVSSMILDRWLKKSQLL